MTVNNMGKNKKHAYLIMAHHRPDILKLLLEALDDPRNDIYLHIDIRAGKEMDPTSFSTEKSELIIVPSMAVNWGGYSQIECELRLLEAAVNHGGYSRYHLMTGATYPLQTQDYIHDFFDNHTDREFIDCSQDNFVYRVQYKYLFNENFREGNTTLRRAARFSFLRVQDLFNIDCFKRFGMDFKKGLAYWSITNELASYVLSQRKTIYKMCRHSLCGDEVFMQTIAYNSPFRDRLTDENGKQNGSLRCTTWPIEDMGIKREGHNFIEEDLAFLMKSNALYALKFEAEVSKRLIEEIHSARDERLIKPELTSQERKPQEPEVSVIIPVYNGENTLEKAVKSVMNGLYQDFEIVLVNDGSLDNSLEICRRLSQEDERIRVIDKPNGGVSSARNRGIEESRGELIAFLDCDDYVTGDYLQILTDDIKKDGIDYSVCGYCNEKKDGEREYVSYFNSEITAVGADAKTLLCEACLIRQGLPGNIRITTACMSVFRRKIIEEHDIRFKEGMRWGEDTLFTYTYAHYVKGFTYSDKKMYVVRRDMETSSDKLMNENSYSYNRELVAEIKHIAEAFGEGNDDYVKIFKYRQLRWALVRAIEHKDLPGIKRMMTPGFKEIISKDFSDMDIIKHTDSILNLCGTYLIKHGHVKFYCSARKIADIIADIIHHGK